MGSMTCLSNGVFKESLRDEGGILREAQWSWSEGWGVLLTSLQGRREASGLNL